jgi:hypothetical protein
MLNNSDGLPSTSAKSRKPESGLANLAEVSVFISITTLGFDASSSETKDTLIPTTVLRVRSSPALGGELHGTKETPPPLGEQEGDDASEQGGEPEEGPEGTDVPANDDAAGSKHQEEPGGNDAQANNAQANNNAAGSTWVSCMSPSTLSTDSALISDWI